MAQISVSDHEVADWDPKISGIVEWFGQLQAVDVSGVVPAVHAWEGGGSALRPDVAVPCETREALMAQVPDREGAFVRVPRIATGADSTPPSPTSSAATQAGAFAAAEEGGGAAAAGPADCSPEEAAALASLDLRVGLILSCEKHPDADSLYVEQVDVGEPSPRTIVSGLVKYVELEQMVGRAVVVLANLKPRNMRGIKSHGMLLAASDEGKVHVEPLAPPPGAAPGERLTWRGLGEQGAPAEPNQLQKKKYWEAVQPELRTSAQRVATYKGLALEAAAGPVTAARLAGARIG